VDGLDGLDGGHEERERWLMASAEGEIVVIGLDVTLSADARSFDRST
jgi:hypothetical protein